MVLMAVTGGILFLYGLLIAAGPQIITGIIVGYLARQLAAGIGLGITIGVIMFALLVIAMVALWMGVGSDMDIVQAVVVYVTFEVIGILITVYWIGRPKRQEDK